MSTQNTQKELSEELEEELKDVLGEKLDEEMVESIDPRAVAENNPEYVEEAEARLEKKKKQARKAVEEAGERLLDLEEKVEDIREVLDHAVTTSQLSSLEERISQLEEELEDVQKTGLGPQSRKDIEKKYGISFPDWIIEEKETLPTHQALLALRGLINDRRDDVVAAVKKIGSWESEEEDDERVSDYYHARHKLKKQVLTPMNTWFDAAGEYYAMLTGEEAGVWAEQNVFSQVMDLAYEGHPPMDGWGTEDILEQIEDFLHYGEEKKELREVMNNS